MVRGIKEKEIDPLSDEALEEVQAEHLQLVEEWADSMPRFYGVPIVKCLAYEIVQVLNNKYLEDVIPHD